jgi:hypothetical protein
MDTTVGHFLQAQIMVLTTVSLKQATVGQISAPPELGLNKLYNHAVRVLHVEAVLNVFLWSEALRFQFARELVHA